MSDERKEDCWDCGGAGKFCPSGDPAGSDKCSGCEDCLRCGGSGAEPVPHVPHYLDGSVADPRRPRP